MYVYSILGNPKGIHTPLLLLLGTVVLNLGKPTKTNHIRITFTGTVQADGSTAQVLNTSWCLATSPLNDGKPYLLQAQTHRLPFEFRLPNDDDTKLPSSLKLSSSMGVKYMITAVHDRPFVPERLCSVVKKEIRVLERIDISQPKYGARGYVDKDVRVFGNLPISDDKVHLSLTLPRYAVVRGDILPLDIHIKHYRKLVRVDGIKVHLLRRVYAGKNR
ncbi:hypothetical protein BCR42DRAFT_180210 [Absidia repens]|uniref:Arrestin-like N-terminal domain-containing protein n=1 Tax=Absidia repens TaxID=90262 RepID=A0A1X2HYI8_9FUNG|nr:hypothetical protein BCR42DRAFT_180210 [Absidia repens]